MSQERHILIAGGGIAGPSLALLLTRCGHKCTIVERSSNFRTGGQQIDVSGPGLAVIKHMGVYEEIKKRTTGDAGMKFVDADDKTQAAFPAVVSESSFTFVKEIEIMRGALADVLYDATQDSTEYLFGNYITGLKEHESNITASFADGPDRDFDLVIAADGMGSKTRGLAFEKDEIKFNSLGQCMAFMSIPFEEHDGDWSRWHVTAGRRSIMIRPRPKEKITGAYMGIMTSDCQKIARLPVDEQKAEFARLYKDVGWEVPRILKELEEDTLHDFYCQETAQVKMASWVKGRVALLGDAGYCPSPITGQGTSLAFIGAYILAGCISTMLDDIPGALKRYETEMRPFVDQLQTAPPGAPGVIHPQTSWGVKIINTVLYTLAFAQSWGANAMGYAISPLLFFFGGKELTLPIYDTLEKIKVHTEAQ